MVLNELGELATQCWIDIPNHFPNAFLHEFVVMPNHIHGIIELKSANVGVQNFEPYGKCPESINTKKLFPAQLVLLSEDLKLE